MAGYNPSDYFKKKATDENIVKVEFDPRVITKKKTMTDAEISDYLRESTKGTSLGSMLANYGIASSMGKDDRKFHLRLQITNGRIYNIKQAEQYLGVSASTIKTYLKELDIPFDKDNGEITFVSKKRKIW